MNGAVDVATEIAKAIKDIEQVRLLLRGQPELGTVLTLVAERLRLLPSQQISTDADVAREFYRRFAPVKVLLGEWGDRVAFAEEDDGDWLSGVSAENDRSEEHAAGEAGFVAAAERAAQLVRAPR